MPKLMLISGSTLTVLGMALKFYTFSRFDDVLAIVVEAGMVANPAELMGAVTGIRWYGLAGEIAFSVGIVVSVLALTRTRAT